MTSLDSKMPMVARSPSRFEAPILIRPCLLVVGAGQSIGAEIRFWDVPVNSLPIVMLMMASKSRRNAY